MNWILDLPPEVRLAVLFVTGTCLGALANLAIYRLAWCPRSIGPWTQRSPHAPARHWTDRIPIFGWLGMRREADIHGAGFWIRPMFLELLCGVGLAALYSFEVEGAGLLPEVFARPAPDEMLTTLHVLFFAHVMLIWALLAASMIDLDEKTIPDAITLPGTVAGLMLAAIFPWSLLPDLVPELLLRRGGIALGMRPDWWQLAMDQPWPFLHVASPNAWPAYLGGRPQVWSLAVGLTCWWMACVAVMPRSWYPRHGLRRAMALCLARLVRSPVTRWIAALGVLGSVGIAAVWYGGGIRWTGLLTALAGMAVGGGLVWVIRIIASACMKREAMGFGDVTLMAMIGTFLGWQTCLVIFFLAPLGALVVGISGWVLRRDDEIPYGPYLSLAALLTIVYWPSVWGRMCIYFEIPWLVPAAIIGCITLMPLILGAMQLAKRPFRE